MDKRTERILQLANSHIYAVFGFGTGPIEFSRRILELKEGNLIEVDLLFDIANRVHFVDFLRFQIGWESEALQDVGENFQVSRNLDALEIYLLCTCIDSLSGDKTRLNYNEWLEENPQLIPKIF
jgi:hypothetical protein